MASDREALKKLANEAASALNQAAADLDKLALSIEAGASWESAAHLRNRSLWIIRQIARRAAKAAPSAADLEALAAPPSAQDEDEGLRAALSQLDREVAKARAKHAPMHSPHEGHSVIREELEELWEHVTADTGRTDEARKEAMQVAAMGLRYVLDLCVPLPPPPAGAPRI